MNLHYWFYCHCHQLRIFTTITVITSPSSYYQTHQKCQIIVHCLPSQWNIAMHVRGTASPTKSTFKLLQAVSCNRTFWSNALSGQLITYFIKTYLDSLSLERRRKPVYIWHWSDIIAFRQVSLWHSLNSSKGDWVSNYDFPKKYPPQFFELKSLFLVSTEYWVFLLLGINLNFVQR